ncbi:hypothetical protein [Nocardia caishijiensis]|uniref:Uncharacterized protein n=1 Tax=Nocardia caishijiensis TaxID=184756 RepID=A0ABQ6YQR6_9NOCA|nr:hypothetical protein [Nocardia caishijiensis]KAF0848130.1 hypothetical protein FNL39_102277 [Nocardia caishijiensis]
MPETPPVIVGYTHLFPGLELDLPGDHFDLVFADGSEATATLTETADTPAILVTAYRTQAGTEIPETLWPLRRPTDGAPRVKLGKAMR